MPKKKRAECSARTIDSKRRSLPSGVIIGLHVDPDANAITGIVRQTSRVLPAVVDIGHAIAIDAPLGAFVVADVAPLHLVGPRFAIPAIRVTAVAPSRSIVTDSRADDRAGHRGGATPIAATHLIADRGADDAAQNHGAGGVARLI